MMNKLAYAAAGIVLVIIIALIVGVFIVIGSPTTTAFINIEYGEVEVDTGSGWEQATDQMELDLNDKVRTLDGEATIILYESVVISLDPDTEVVLSDLDIDNLKIEQSSGSTWSKFTDITGVGDFSIETPNTVATVRGTFFGVDTDVVRVGEGVVEVESNGKKLIIREGKKAILQNGMLIEKDLTKDDIELMVGKMQRTITQLKELREREANKHPIIIKQIKKKYGASDQEISQFLEQADTGRVDLDAVERQSPVKIASVHKIRLITEEIAEHNNVIDMLKSMKTIEKINKESTETNDERGVVEIS